MKQARLDQLADGIFAIVMTILVFEIRVPEFVGPVTDALLLDSFYEIYPLFLSYLLSFALLFTYWRSHHFIVSVFAKNIDMTLTNINAVFFFFVGLVPFSAHFLGTYSTHHLAIIFFATNIFLISLILYIMRRHVEKSESIENMRVTHIENMHAYTRILFPLVCAVIAVLVSFYNTRLALFLFTVGILFNILPGSTSAMFSIFEFFIGKKIK